ncbi:tetratricopeptide repeat protein [Pontimicrobium sp. SW4]|uniref:Tetratricopeptide repeat protein n=1 Tax=Pontimicrobium sp. SW4 TaxID=3153519 RepID=A0AAU7BSQ4_9FLAO
MKHLLFFILIFSVSSVFSQEKDKALQKSNDFVYQGNTLIEDDFISAEKEYRKAISKKPSNAVGAYNLGNAYYETKNYDEALLRHIEAANVAKTKEEKHRAFHNVGNTLMKQKKCKEAVEAYKNALRNNPNDEESRYNLVVAKECAKEQQQNEDKNKDKDKKDEDKEDEKKEDKEKEDDGEKKDENKDEGDQDKKDGDDEKDDQGKPKDDENKKKDGDPKNKNDKPQQQPGKLSPQQVKNLLEAMNNEEKKVQQKINAKKAQGKKVKAEKDW